MDYVKRLQQIREEKKMSLEECAQQLAISPEFLNMIELGELLPTEQQTAAIIEFVLDQI